LHTFSRIVTGRYYRGVTNLKAAAEVGDVSLNAASFLRYLEICGRLE